MGAARMCGIAGIKAKKGEVDGELIRKMTATMYHRGPIEDGYLLGPQIGLGMRRLSIIDVAGGQQPVFNEDRSIAVVLNGQIYNYIELRDDLERRGHRFRTESDTEVIVHLYEEVGADLLARLNGMFAFALWDYSGQSLFVARDRLGVKPLYYYEDERRFAFASELKALLQCDFVSRDVNRSALSDYLALLYVPGPASVLRDVHKLLPGHYLRVDSSGTHVAQYWNAAEHYVVRGLSRDEATEGVRSLLRDSVRLRLRSDVPVGAFLSGGLDSSMLVALASEQSARTLRTYAVRFEGDDEDELSYARMVATAFATDHHELTVTPQECLARLPQLVWHLDEPSGDSAVVPSYLVSEFAARDLRVVLSGLGGDELFGGYARYFDGLPVEHLYRRLPQAVRSPISWVAGGMPGAIGRRLRWNALPVDARYLAALENFSATERRALLGQDRGALDPHALLASLPTADPVNRLLAFDMQTYLPDDVLHITDRMSMAVSLEARTPFLDFRLVEFCAGLPGAFKLTQSARAWKIALKDAAASALPAAILERPKKGFNAPVLAWVLRLLPDIRRLLRDSEAVRQGILNRAALDPIVRADPRTRSEAQRLWLLLILEVWTRVFLGANAGAKPSFTLHELAS